MQVISELLGATGTPIPTTSADIISNLPIYLSHGSQESDSFTCFTLSLGSISSKSDSDLRLTTADITNWQLASIQELREDEEFQRQHGFLREGEAEKCTICLCNFESCDEGNIVRLGKCSSHFFHIDCIEQCRGDKDFVKCPNCGIIYGVMTGHMPEGTMTVSVYSRQVMACEGYDDTNVLYILYQFPNGKLPNKRQYRGTAREAFLPNTPEGREVLALLITAFERRLTFTVGTSVTTGREDCVVWNGIHHKTSVSGGTSCFGYPDPTYFYRVTEELAAKGVYRLKEEALS